jgi:dTDP-4-amino-4,6-dideoxygalactose transaminase
MDTNSDSERISLCPPWYPVEERGLLLETLDTDWITTVGPNLSAFEREFCEVIGGGSAAAVTSGTAALHLALRVLGVGPGDEVLCPNLTFIASVNAAVYLGAKPVIIGIEEQSWNMCPDLLEKALKKRADQGKPPKAVVVVHIYGQPANMDAICSICDRYGVPVVEDAAEALGTRYRGRHVGLHGKLGIFSFNGNKMITTGGGGMVVSRDSDLVNRIHHLSFQGKAHGHDYIHPELAYNYRMSNVLAAIGRGQLKTLERRLAIKAQIFDRYRRKLEAVPGFSMMPSPPFGQPSYWMSVVSVSREVMSRIDRIEVIREMDRRKIQIRPVWYPMHLQPCFEGSDREISGIAEDIHSRSFCLPSGFTLTEAQQDRVIRELIDVVSR